MVCLERRIMFPSTNLYERSFRRNLKKLCKGKKIQKLITLPSKIIWTSEMSPQSFLLCPERSIIFRRLDLIDRSSGINLFYLKKSCKGKRVVKLQILPWRRIVKVKELWSFKSSFQKLPALSWEKNDIPKTQFNWRELWN